MHKIDGPGHLNNTFVSEDAAAGRAPTLVTPEWLNGVQGELTAVVEAAGLPLNKGNNQQVSEALAVLARQQKHTAFSTAGAAPNFTLTVVPTLAAYAAGQRFRVKFHAGVTGASTINVNGLGARSLKQYDYAGNKANAAIATGQLVDAEYDGVDFVLLDPLPGFPVQPGEVTFFAMIGAPAGYMKANGAAVSRTTYAALFAAIGTVFGAGDGVSTFNLPDMRGEFLRGFDDGRGVDVARVFGASQAATAIANYAHSDAATPGATSAICNYFVNHDGVGPLTTNPNSGYYMTAASTSNSGNVYAGTATVRPRNVALLACIKF